MLLRIVLRDVHSIIYLHPTTEKEKVLLPSRNNREEIASTQSSLQVQHASVERMTPTVNRSDFVILSFFFGFSQKLHGRVTRKEIKAHGLLEVKVLALEYDVDFIAVSETWFNSLTALQIPHWLDFRPIPARPGSYLERWRSVQICQGRYCMHKETGS